MHNLVQCLLFIGLLSIGTGKAVQADDLRGFVLASSCVSCHGDASPNGAGIPAIVGRDAAFIADEKFSFRRARIDHHAKARAWLRRRRS